MTVTRAEWLTPRAGVGVVGMRLASALLVVGVIAVAVALVVTGPMAPLLSRELDAPGSSFFQSHAPPDARLLRSMSALGDPAVAGTIVLALCTIIGASTHTWLPMCAAATAWLGALVITSVVRLVTARSNAYGPSGGFPSGHALIAASVFGTLAALAVQSGLPRPVKAVVVMLGLAVPVAVAWARLALLAHVPSDVIGGALLGATWAAAVVLAVRRPNVS
jgi:undecaprenyl-diphosphatase